MKKIIKVILILLLLGCNRVNEIDSVRIINNNSVFAPGDSILIELYVPFNELNTPAFYLFSEEDTLALPFDYQKGCAIYKAYHKMERKHSYAGYVLYTSSDHIKKKSSFEINYEIRK